MAQSPEEMAASMKANLKEKTGKTLPQWLKVTAKFAKDEGGTVKHGQIVKHLKSDHGMTHGFANLVAHEHLGGLSRDGAGDDLVDAQYAGKKAVHRPIYDKLVKMVGAFGKDVEVSPKKTYVALRRSKQFAIVKPSTATRVDIGLNLKGEAPAGRLEPAGSLGSMVTHRIQVTGAREVDAEVKRWLKEAYSRA